MERSQLKILRKRLEDEPRQFIQVIYGPRQIGKTTLVRQFIEKTSQLYHFVTADSIPTSNNFWIAQQWDIARLKLRQNEASSIVLIIDEIQKIVNWSEQVKKEWDTDTSNKMSVKLVILGSSRLLIQKGLTESLTGRFESIYMGHWTFSEMNEAFNFSSLQYVWFGGYPGSAALIDDEDRWKKYLREAFVEASISKDILMLNRIDKPALLKNLFDTGTFYSGQIMSLTKILGQLDDAGNVTTLANYLNLLDSAGLMSGLQKFSRGLVKQKASSPKFQIQNMALKSAQSSHSFTEIYDNKSEWGRWVESAVGAHLLNFCKTGMGNLYYWRERNLEIDFVLEYKSRLIGLEIKSGDGKIDSFKGMKSFDDTFHPDKILIIGKDGIPWEDFLKHNPSDMF